MLVGDERVVREWDGGEWHQNDRRERVWALQGLLFHICEISTMGNGPGARKNGRGCSLMYDTNGITIIPLDVSSSPVVCS